MRCQAILVNYHGAQLICDAAESLAGDPECDEIHVVDNSVGADQAAWLREHLRTGVRLTVSPENLGFARACNLAFADSDADCVLLLNPDARLLPGALRRLKETLSAQPEVGAVGPRVFWDVERQFLLPPSTYPSRMGFALDRLGECWPALAAHRADRFRRRSLREWQQTEPFRVNALSGGHVLLRRSALLQAGGLFDPRFFMYWEDSDLMRRLQDAGQQLLLDPRAEAVHLYEHSPGKDGLISQGWPAFAQKYFASAWWSLLARMAARYAKDQGVADFAVIDSSASDDCIEIHVPAELRSAWLLEFSPSPRFVPSIGRLGCGEYARLPRALAARFKGREYYLRLGARCPTRVRPLLYLVHGD